VSNTAVRQTICFGNGQLGPLSQHWREPAGQVLDACDYCDAFTGSTIGTITGLVGAIRATSVFRGRNLGRGSPNRQVVELLYGYPAFLTPGLPALVPNIFGAPTMGLAGFGNAFNGYSWSAASHDGSAFFGTFDFSDTLNLLINGLLRGADIPFSLEIGTPGADLVRVNQTRIESATFETISGFDNDRNWGFRTLLSMPCEAKSSEPKEMLMVGSANPYSIHPLGGWFLHCLHKK
jgi:hypothetical protein